MMTPAIMRRRRQTLAHYSADPVRVHAQFALYFVPLILGIALAVAIH